MGLLACALESALWKQRGKRKADAETRATSPCCLFVNTYKYICKYKCKYICKYICKYTYKYKCKCKCKSKSKSKSKCK